MTTDESTTQKPDNPGVDEFEEQIEQTREDLGATVDELSHRLDVKGRAHEAAVDVKAHVQEKAADVGAQVQETATRAREAVVERTGGLRDGAVCAARSRNVQVAAGGALVLGLGAAALNRRRNR